MILPKAVAAIQELPLRLILNSFLLGATGRSPLRIEIEMSDVGAHSRASLHVFQYP
jgi:hypothetical protein